MLRRPIETTRLTRQVELLPSCPLSTRNWQQAPSGASNFAQPESWRALLEADPLPAQKKHGSINMQEDKTVVESLLSFRNKKILDRIVLARRLSLAGHRLVVPRRRSTQADPDYAFR